AWRWQTIIDREHAAEQKGNASLTPPQAKPPFRWLTRFRFPFSSQLFAVNDSTIEKSLMRETERELTIAAIALERFRLKHGAYPESLAALQPEFISTVPRDTLNA